MTSQSAERRDFATPRRSGGTSGNAYRGQALAQPLFLSTFLNKLDRKGRVSVPAPFRTALAGQSFAGIVAYRSFKLEAIEGCGYDRIDEMAARVDALPEFSDERDDLAGIFADAQSLPFDSEGRIVLPENLVGYAALTDTVAFVGLGRTFQLWEPQRYEQRQAELRERARRHGATLPGRQPDRVVPAREPS
jgi:MraZ protein